MTSIFLFLCYLMFPLCIYFLYLVYSRISFEKENNLFLDLALFSSFFICSRFGDLPFTMIFLLNVPLLLALYKKRHLASIFLAVATPVYLSNYYNIDVVSFIIQYIVILLLGIFSGFKLKNIFLVCKILYVAYLMFLVPEITFNLADIYFLCLIWIVMYFVFEIILAIYKRIEVIVKLHYTMEEITKEKALYESLFKITHEIKNPLAVCKGYLEMFDANNVSKSNRYIGIIGQEIDRTLELLKDFSNISKLNITKDIMSINMLMDDVSDEAKMIFKESNRFIYDINQEEIEIMGDYNRLKQVMLNILKNSKEATEKNKGSITLITEIKNKHYIISIIDEGIGMDVETKRKIGTPFYTTKKTGTGLGVCFSKEIVERHHGTMKYYSKVGKGTKVVIKLPIQKTST